MDNPTGFQIFFNVAVGIKHMSKTSQTDDLSPEEEKDIDEFYTSDDRRTTTVQKFLEELHNA